ncbi:MAG: type II secretion system F family protein [Desulfobacteraceae bacterium]|jgi:tight adherence protein C
MDLTLIIVTLTFLLVTSATLGLYAYLEERYRRFLVTKRIFGSEKEARAFEKDRMEESGWFRAVRSLGLMATPRSEKELKTIRRLLSHAGYRSTHAVMLYFGLKLGLALVFGGVYLFVIFVSGNLDIRSFIFTFLFLGAGYYLPGLLLKMQIASRQQAIQKELPDALDLLLICIEAGLSFDMALYRVSREMDNVSPILSREFSQYFLETQSGLPRKQVLKNLAERNGVNSLSSIVNVLIQSSKFGTDIAEALRVYSEAMRRERQKKAEEKGAKISTKLTFPMIMLIMPALLIVVLGPVLINLLNHFQGRF